MGLGDLQVGRSHECDYPSSVQTLPICSRPAFPVSGSSLEINYAVRSRLSEAASLYEVDLQTVTTLAPTHIITQSQCEVCAVSLRDVERALQSETQTTARLISLQPNSLQDIWADVIRIAIDCGRSEAGQRLVKSLTSEVKEIAATAKSAPDRPHVACIEWLEPLMAAGNWIPELIAFAGAHSLFGEAGKHSPWMTWEALVETDPEVIIAMPCGFDLHRTRAEMHWLCDRPEWPELTAVKAGEVFLCDGNQFMNRPGPRIVESLRICAEILHPDLFPATLEHIGWERF